MVIPHSHTWFWTQICVASLIRNPPCVEGFEARIVVVDNSPWSPAIKTLWPWVYNVNSYPVRIMNNHKSNKFHASALDCVVEMCEFDYLMSLETDVMALRPTWLQWFVDMMRPTDYAVGMWHHEQFVNPSCTLYRGDVLRDMMGWCKTHPSPNTLRWGPLFGKSAPLDSNLTPDVLSDPRDLDAAQAGFREWVAGPFAEKRGWPAGTELKEQPSGQMKGPGWYEPGQQLHHWAVQAGYTYTVCPTMTTKRADGLPLQTMYGGWGADEPSVYPPGGRTALGPMLHDHRRQLEAVELFGNAETAHLWGGTRALDILKHDVTCQFVKRETPGWLAREARFWRQVVPPDVRDQTLGLIRKFGWHTTGQGTPDVTDRDRAAAQFVRECYEAGGVTW